MLTTLLAPSAGTARVCGFDVARQPGEVRRRIGYVMQRVELSNRLLTGREKAELEAALYHIPRRRCRARAAEVLELVGLLPHADRLIGEYSGGMQKRLDLACGLLHRPELLILDEPSLGLDVQSRHRIWEHLLRLRAEGVTILLATNYLDEADRLCDRLTILDGGRAVVCGSPAELKRAVGADVVQVETSDPDRLRAAIAGQPWVRRLIVVDSGALHLYVDDAAVALPTVLRTTVEGGVELGRVAYSQPTLDDVFLLHTGRELRELEAGA
jgi:ABC-2 type transport system ATP-binding protein